MATHRTFPGHALILVASTATDPLYREATARASTHRHLRHDPQDMASSASIAPAQAEQRPTNIMSLIPLRSFW